MSVARITEITSTSKKSFEDAVDNGIERASKTLKNVTGRLGCRSKCSVKDGKVSSYQVRLKVTFILE